MSDQPWRRGPGFATTPAAIQRRHVLAEKPGFDAARVIPGHTSAAVPEIYAELGRKQAAEIMGAVG